MMSIHAHETSLPASQSKPRFSVVSPVYGCVKSLPALCDRLLKTLEPLASSAEIILVDDASPDGAWGKISELARQDSRIKGIELSRNFGQHYAIAAGLDHAAGDVVIVLDCDLQDQPEMIPRMFQKLQETQADLVAAASSHRTDSSVQQILSWGFYRAFDWLRGGPAESRNYSFIMMRSAVVQAYRRMRESRRLHLAILEYIGFRIAVCEVETRPRTIGKSSYSTWARIRLAMFGVVSGTTRLLSIGVYLGFALAILSLLLGAYILIMKLTVADYAAGWPSTITAIFFVGGMNLLVTGILGIYLETIFYESKGRPLYIVRTRLNLEQNPFSGIEQNSPRDPLSFP